MQCKCLILVSDWSTTALHSKVAFALPAVQKIKSSKNFKIGRGVSSGEYDIKRNARPARYRPLPPPNRHQREPIRDHETSFDLLLRKEEPGYKFLTLDIGAILTLRRSRSRRKIKHIFWKK